MDAIRIETSDGYTSSTTTELYDNCTLRNIGIRDMSGKGLVLIARGGVGKARFIQNFILDDIVIEQNKRSGLYIEGSVIETSFRSVHLRRTGTYTSATVPEKLDSNLVISASYAIPYKHDATQEVDGYVHNIGFVAFPQRLHFQNLVMYKGQPVIAEDGVSANTGIGIYINAGSNIVFTSTDIEDQYIGIEADSYYPLEDTGNGGGRTQPFVYQTIFDVTVDHATYANNSVPQFKGINIKRCINFKINNVYSYGNPSSNESWAIALYGASFVQYGIYIAANYPYEVQNVVIDTQSKFGYTFIYDRRACIVAQYTLGKILTVYGAGRCLARVNSPWAQDEPQTYRIEKIELSPSFDPPTGTQIVCFSGYSQMTFYASILAANGTAYLHSDFVCATLQDTLTLEWREVITDSPVEDAQNNGAWYEVARTNW
jgi:hypothetical protein